MITQVKTDQTIRQTKENPVAVLANPTSSSLPARQGPLSSSASVSCKGKAGPPAEQSGGVCAVVLHRRVTAERYVGTAVSRLRRPCLSLRLLLYSAISSRAEVAGSGGGASTSGLALFPEKNKR